MCSDKLLHSPFVWEQLKYFFTAGDGYREKCSISQIHEGNVLKEQTMNILMPSMSEKNKFKNHFIFFWAFQAVSFFFSFSFPFFPGHGCWVRGCESCDTGKSGCRASSQHSGSWPGWPELPQPVQLLPVGPPWGTTKLYFISQNIYLVHLPFFLLPLEMSIPKYLQ